MGNKVVIDGTALLFPHIGLSRVVGYLVKELFEEPQGLEFALYSRCLARGVPQELKDKYPFYHFPFPRAFEPLIRRFKAIERWSGGDLFHAVDHYMPVNKPSKTIVTLHDVMFLKDPDKDWEAHRHFAKYVPQFAKECRGIITCSEYSKKDIVEQLHIDPAKIDVIYWGIDTKLFYPIPSKEAMRHELHPLLGNDMPYILAVGCSTGRKNTLRLLRCYQRLIDKQGQHKLVVCWDPPPFVKEQYAREIEAGDIVFTGKVNDEILRKLYQGASAMIYPSYYEGFGLPILEAMACGTPVITSNCTSMPEIGGSAAHYIDPYSDDALMAAMQAAFYGAMPLEQMRSQGLERVQQFTWKQCGQQHIAVYKKYLQ